MRILLSIFIAAFVILTPVTTAASVDVSKLIKLSPENNANCIEYYIYKKALYCSTTVQAPQTIDASLIHAEKLNIAFDKRPWQIAWGKQTPMITTIEYIPDGEDINNWHELVTSQYFPGLQDQITPLQYALSIIQDLKDTGYQTIIQFLQKTPNQVIFEFRIESPQNQRQDELQMIKSDQNGIYVLHYVIKNADMGQPNRDKWLQNLKASNIK